jgi:hypothetical protein
MTTETSQIETVTRNVATVYRNDKHPKAVIQTIEGERYSDYDGKNIPEEIRAGDLIDITYKQNGDFRNIIKAELNPNDPRLLDVIENTAKAVVEEARYIENEVLTYATIYKELVENGIPPELANTSASTIYIQLKRRRN